jgi:conjugal transfer/entry exclusion protein
MRMNVATPNGSAMRAVMNLRLIVAILAISAVPIYAQAQTAGTAKLKADAQNVVQIISSDKRKAQIYCQIAELSDEIDQEENPAKTEELSQKIDNLEHKLGAEYTTLVGNLKDIDPNSQDAREIGSILEALDSNGLPD